LVDGDRQPAKAAPGSVVHGVRDGGSHADDPDLADSLHPERIEPVRLTDENHVDVLHVRIHRNQIVAKRGIGDAPRGMGAYRSACLIGIAAGLLAASSARPAVGALGDMVQAQDTTQMMLVVSTFSDQAGAKRVMDDMRRSKPTMVQRMQSYGVVVEDQRGNVRVDEKHGNIDGVVALLGQPRGGGVKDTPVASGAGLSASDAARVRQMLTPGTSAIIVMVPAGHSRDTHAAMQGAQAVEVFECPVQSGR
jgi:hypothetical protein